MRSASGVGAAVSNRSPATSTTSTAFAAGDGGDLGRAPPRARRPGCGRGSCGPTCQSAVCRSFTSRPTWERTMRVRLGRGSSRQPPTGRGAGGWPRVGAVGLAARVAHAGNGNSSTSGIGSSGWRDDHRARLDDRGPLALHGRQEAVLAAAGLGRVEAADDADRRVGDDAALDLARRLLAPMSTMPSERPRSATSSRISLIGLDPSRGAYLLSSSSTTNCSGRAWPERSLSSNALRRITPTTNRLARSLRLWRSTTVTWCSSKRDAGARSGWATSARTSGATWRTRAVAAGG